MTRSRPEGPSTPTPVPDAEAREHARLGERLGHAFSDADGLKLALTHRSRSGGRNNERLEFLGDALLGFVVADELYRRHPQAKESELTLMRASLVRRQSLAEAARAVGLGEFVRLGEGERKSGGFRRDSILADALEAVVGAVYLDAGIDAARAVILRLLGERLEAVRPEEAGKDPKTRLQEHLQARGEPLPSYAIVEESGDDHARVFVVDCRVDALGLHARGRGGTRRTAEQQAAASALGMLEEGNS